MKTQPLKSSIQLFSLRKVGDLDRQLDAAAEAGFRHVELVSTHLEDACSTREKLQSRGLSASSSHVSLAALHNQLDLVKQACKALDIEQIFISSVPKEERNNESLYWMKLGRELAQFAEHLSESDIELGYHNHNWDVQPRRDGRTPLELLFGVPGSPLRWQADLAWLVRAKVDPTQWIRRFVGRVTSVHAKDIAPAGMNVDEDGWTDLGAGILDWQPLAKASREAGARWIVAEHDNPRDGAKFAKRSYAYLDGLTKGLGD